MGVIADKIATMRGCSLTQIVETISAMEKGFDNPSGMEFNIFWTYYPHKRGRRHALAAYIAARKRRHTGEQIMDGLHRYLQYKPGDQPWLNPATFLNGEYYLDQPASVARKGVDLFFDAAMEMTDAYAAGNGSLEGSDRSPAGGLAQSRIVHHPGHR